MNDNKVTDGSADRSYFTITPRLVGLFCESTFEYTLWNVIKEIAGEDGECFLSTPDLAVLAMQSTGKVSQMRRLLIKKGLLEGEVRRDPGYSQPVWHLRIPDLWERNIKLVAEVRTIKDRVEFKKRQKSVHVVKPSPHEEGTSQDEEGTIPHERKKNQKEKPKEDYLDHLFDFSRSEHAERLDVSHRPEGWQTPDIREEEFEICKLVADLWLRGELPTIARFIDAQVEAAGALLKLHDSNDRATRETIRSYFDKYEEQWRRTVRRPFTVLGPQSLVGVVTSYLADLDRAEAERMPPPGGRVTT